MKFIIILLNNRLHTSDELKYGSLSNQEQAFLFEEKTRNSCADMWKFDIFFFVFQATIVVTSFGAVGWWYP
ncbi:hypothetical protein P8452_57432 [Trifolium repens]|nr:hypothetical protein P8452_57432 [Trifolium repens]